MTLRRKIVALTLSLLLPFAMTAAASVLLQSKISEQFSGVVDDYLPLKAAVATIDVFTDRWSQKQYPNRAVSSPEAEKLGPASSILLRPVSAND